MKYRLLSFLFWIFVLSSCNNEPKETYIDFDFYIDSINNITSTSATVKATLTIHRYGTKNISGLFVSIGTTSEPMTDSLYRVLDFDKKEGTVEMTITDLKPNTTYYISPMARINSTNNNPYVPNITAMGSPRSDMTFTTLSQ